jgi:hypothetical protein
VIEVVAMILILDVSAMRSEIDIPGYIVTHDNAHPANQPD